MYIPMRVYSFNEKGRFISTSFITTSTVKLFSNFEQTAKKGFFRETVLQFLIMVLLTSSPKTELLRFYTTKVHAERKDGGKRTFSVLFCVLQKLR